MARSSRRLGVPGNGQRSSTLPVSDRELLRERIGLVVRTGVDLLQ